MLTKLKNKIVSLIAVYSSGDKEDIDEVTMAINYLVNHEDINSLLTESSSKLYNLSMYTTDMGDLFRFFSDKEHKREIKVVNINKYFSETDDIAQSLIRVKEALGLVTVSQYVKRDICELYDACQYLDSINRKE